MAQYLSDEWFDELSVAAGTYTMVDATSGTVSLRERITNSPFGDITYVMIIEDGGIEIVRDADRETDVTFSQDYATAVGLHRGELTTNDAFFAGRVRVSGHLNTLLQHADLLQGIAPAFEKVQATTTYA